MDEKSLIKFIEHMAAESAKVILPAYANPDLQVDLKADKTPVTEADIKAEEVLRALINKEFPGHGIIGEEFGSENEDAEYVWVLDPIDGTIGFAAGSPIFGTLICLTRNGQPVLGAINHPVLNQLVIGNNEVTTYNGRPVKVGNTEKIEDAIVLTTDTRRPERLHNGANWRELIARARHLRTWGDCYGYLMVSCARADVMIDPIMNKWDLLALIPVIRGAGGIITDYHGNDPVVGSSAVAANPVLHPQIIELLNKA